jgi:LacI family transcriptional regulator
MRRVTIEDVARAAGVSRQTVSRAINQKGDISPETRERVLAVVQSLGFRPNRLAQGMVTQRTHTVGIEVADITNPFFAEMVRGAQDVAAKHGYHLFLTNSDDNPAVALQSLSNLVSHGVDGLITMFANGTDEEISAFADQYRPIVLINRTVEHPHIGLVTADIYQGAVQAVEYLVRQGHTAIAMLNHPSLLHGSSRRLQAYCDTLQRHGRTAHPDWIEEGEPTLQGGYEATQRLLTACPEVTAIFGYNDLMSLGALRACRDAGRAVPQECVVIGFDDIPLAAMMTPSLSTVHCDSYVLGQQAMLRLLDMMEAPGAVFSPIELACNLILRESTKSHHTSESRYSTH